MMFPVSTVFSDRDAIFALGFRSGLGTFGCTGYLYVGEFIFWSPQFSLKPKVWAYCKDTTNKIATVFIKHYCVAVNSVLLESLRLVNGLLSSSIGY